MILLRGTLKQADMRSLFGFGANTVYASDPSTNAPTPVPAPTITRTVAVPAVPNVNIVQQLGRKAAQIVAEADYQKAVAEADIPTSRKVLLASLACLVAAWQTRDAAVIETAQEVNKLARLNLDEANKAVFEASKQKQAVLTLA